MDSQLRYTESELSSLNRGGVLLSPGVGFTLPSLASALRKVSTQPDPRVISAAAATIADLNDAERTELMEELRGSVALRLTGYLLETYAAQVFPENFAAGFPGEPPLFLSPVLTAGRVRRMLENASETQRRWSVFGTIDPPLATFARGASSEQPESPAP
jgi:hypothetical protein